MTLRLEQIMGDIERMGSTLDPALRREWLAEARRLLRSHDRERLRDKLRRQRAASRPLLAPEPLGDLEERVAPPPRPGEHVVIAVDGSSIAPDRHAAARYYLLNTGWIILRYGEAPGAEIDSHAQLFYRPEDLFWDRQRQVPVDEQRLSLMMRIEEIALLPELAEAAGGPAVAMVDGQLILWALQGERSERRGPLLDRLFDAFDRLRELRVPVVGYISNTASFELVNALRIYLCPTTPDACRRCHEKGEAEVRLCFHLNELRDPALLFEFLEAGERSCLFESRAEILEAYPAAHRITYFYMSTGDEIARVEVPRWVADDPTLLGRVHAVLHDQCHRSGQQPPYPPALHEAHEAAVISSADREWVRMLVEDHLEPGGAALLRSAKNYHKRARGV